MINLKREEGKKEERKKIRRARRNIEKEKDQDQDLNIRSKKILKSIKTNQGRDQDQDLQKEIVLNKEDKSLMSGIKTTINDSDCIKLLK